MAVIPSFGSYAPKPDLAGAYLGRQRNILAQIQLAAQIQQDQQRIALEGQRLSQQRAIAEMESMARAEAQAKEAHLKQQEIEIEKAYREGHIRMQEQQLTQAQEQINLKAQEAQRQFEAQQQMRNAVSQEGFDPVKTWYEWGPQAGLASIPAGAFPDDRGPALSAPEIVKSGDREFYRNREGGPFVPMPTPAAVVNIEPRQVRAEMREEIESKIQALEKLQTDTKRVAAQMYADPNKRKKMTLTDIGYAEGYIAREAELKTLRDKLARMQSQALGQTNMPAAELPGGMAPSTSTTNSLPRIISIRRK